MTADTGRSRPRVVVIAGPNGSGKSSLTIALQRDAAFPAVYVNPDEIARELSGGSELERSQRAFHAAEARREGLFNQRADFAFETVFSHPSKVLLLQRMREAGYRVTLYYVTTRDPVINVERVRQRVREGGHAVPEERIAPRYRRCHQLFPRVVETADEAFVFDASSLPPRPVFEWRQGSAVPFPSLPEWVEIQLLQPLRERFQERLSLANTSEGAASLPILADEASGSYAGLLQVVRQHYALQTRLDAPPETPAVRHDLALLERGRAHLWADHEVTFSYRDGWATLTSIGP